VPIAPDKEASGAARGYELHAATILNSSGEKPIAVAAYDKAIREGAFAEKLGGRVLGLKLQELIGNERHLRVRDVAEWNERGAGAWIEFRPEGHAKVTITISRELVECARALEFTTLQLFMEALRLAIPRAFDTSSPLSGTPITADGG
jgi:hypothetical protein